MKQQLAIPGGLGGPDSGRKKQQSFRALLESSAGPILLPGAYDALSARLIEDAGFCSCYLTGAGLANSQLGLPDVGLTTLSEVVWQVQRVSDAIALPLIVDADTGYGGPLSVMRTCHLLEAAGAAGIQLEDQANPKKCGHFSRKQVVDTKAMVARIVAATMARSDPDVVIIARTDARETEGLKAALERAKAYRDAGADVIFIEAPQSTAEIYRIPEVVTGVHLMINMVEESATPQLSLQELGDAGYKIVLYANFLLRSMAASGLRALEHLLKHGDSIELRSEMLPWDVRQEIVGLPAISSLEARIEEEALERVERSSREEL